jgi:ABC-2 type transport system permease protein
MTWQAVARKDFQDAVRSRWLWALSAIFVGLFVGGAYFLGSNLNGEAQQQVTANAFFQSIVGQLLITLIVPLVAIVISYGAIVGERESGSLKLLLSLPHSRLDAVVGKTVGRSGVVAVPIFVGLLLASIVLAVYGVGIDVIDFIVFGILTMLLGVVFVSLAVGVSAAASTNRRAMLGSVGLFFVFTFLWNRVRQILSLVNDQLSLNLELMELVKYGLFIKYFNPVRAYQTLAARLYSDTVLQARLYDSGMVGQMIQQQLDSVPFYLSDTVVMAQFLLWLFVPLALGYVVFDDADL